MIDTVYIEEDIIDHPRTKQILSCMPNAARIFIKRYTEVFNKKSQNFRLQKMKPSLILAKKYNNFLHETPISYGIGNKENYYFAHMINCVFDCRYCFLQGMFSSANYVVFVNYEDLFMAIESMTAKNRDKKITYFSGYNCDSMASESLTGFIEEAINFFKGKNNIELEIRTKSTFIKPLLKSYISNCIVAYSLVPEKISEKFEVGVPSIQKRLHSISRLVELGWKIGLRFDPIICELGWEELYNKFFDNIFATIPSKSIHSVTYGSLRFPKKVFKSIEKLYPEEKLFYNKNNLKASTNKQSLIDENISLNVINKMLEKHIDKTKIFLC